MSLFALLPFWVLTQFSKAICPRHSFAHLTYSLTYSFLDTVKDFVLKTFFHNLFHCLRECFVNQLVALHVRIFCKPISRFFWVTAIKHEKIWSLNIPVILVVGAKGVMHLYHLLFKFLEFNDDSSHNYRFSWNCSFSNKMPQLSYICLVSGGVYVSVCGLLVVLINIHSLVTYL